MKCVTSNCSMGLPQGGMPHCSMTAWVRVAIRDTETTKHNDAKGLHTW